MFKAIDRFPVFRSFPTQSKLTVEAAQVLRKVLYNGNITRNLEDHGLRLCYEMGWLHSEATDVFADKYPLRLPFKTSREVTSSSSGVFVYYLTYF